MHTTSFFPLIYGPIGERIPSNVQPTSMKSCLILLFYLSHVLTHLHRVELTEAVEREPDHELVVSRPAGVPRVDQGRVEFGEDLRIDSICFHRRPC